MALEKQEIDDLCLSVFGQRPAGYRAPGGPRRNTILARLEDRPVVIAKRDSVQRAKLEALVLRRLADTGQVPGLIAVEGPFVVQEFCSGARLSAYLDTAEPEEVERIIGETVKSLLALQRAGTKRLATAGLPQIGRRTGWTKDLASVPHRLARSTDISCDLPDPDRVAQLLTPSATSFVKWDARAANALLGTDGKVRWIDWEHCGLRTPTDDLAWLLADEWCPDCPASEAQALALFAQEHGRSLDETTARFRALAVLHSFVRLSLILRRKGEGDWWAHEECLALDLVGVTQACLSRVARRARRWSGEDELLSGYLPLFEGLEARYAG